MRDDNLPPVVFTLLISNALIFVAGEFLGLRVALVTHFALFALDPLFRPWQIVTYAFLHSDVLHLGFNMFALWMFGRTMENVWGSRRFAIYYAVCVVGAALVQILVAHASENPSLTVGASGGVFGILLAFGMTFPNQVVLLIFPPIPLKAKYFVMIYGALELYLGLSRPGSTIAHFAHLGGMVAGLVLILLWRSQRKIR